MCLLAVGVCRPRRACFAREPGNREALEAAKFNLVHHYLLVGTTDRLREFIAMLEVLMPRMFSGAIRALEKGETWAQNDLGSRRVLKLH